MKTAMEALTCKSAALGSVESTNGSSTAHRKTPLLNRIYQTRSKLMHKLVSTGLKTLSEISGNSAEPQLLLLGAGLDTSYNSYTTRTYAVDFAHVIAQRTSFANDKPAIKLVVGDLREADALMSDLQNAGFEMTLPTVILLECVLSYVEPIAAQKLLSTLSKRLSSAIIVMYDPVLAYSNSSSSGLAKMMHEKFAERSAPLLSCAHSVAQYMSNMRLAGWDHVTAVSVNQATQLYLSAAERRADVLSEPFDEFASLALLQNCYAVAIACTRKQAYKRLHELLYAGKVSLAEREQALQDRIALAEARLACLEEHLQQKRQAAVPVNANASLGCVIAFLCVSPTQLHRLVALSDVVLLLIALLQGGEHSARSSDGHAHARAGLPIGMLSIFSEVVHTVRCALYDLHLITYLLLQAFEAPAQKYASVKKYVKFSLKALKEFEK